MIDEPITDTTAPTTNTTLLDIATENPPNGASLAIRLDLGCGAKKRPGHVGIDFVKRPGVDVHLNLDKEPLPYEDSTVDSVFSSHFFEHTQAHRHLLNEMTRVCKPGAPIEIWTPYVKTDTAMLLSHIAYLSETSWEHYCIQFPEIWFGDRPAIARLDEIRYIVSNRTRQMIGDVPLWFAIRFFQNVCVEFGVKLTVLKGDEYIDKAAYKKTVQAPKVLIGGCREQLQPLQAPNQFWKISG